ncbi:hypothetical protein GCK32_014858 [Trichostrongylus colubriformis]|uniref:Uncharacterized protein n=1 Tax=Trichostrongylus colubriformis TaxID=6319 RepID=A0AAN8ILN1_TRICO
MCIEIHPPVPVKMFYATVHSLIFLLTAQARLQGPFGTESSDWSSNRHNALSRGPHGSDRFSGKSNYVEHSIKNSMSMLGDYGVTIGDSAANGTITVTAMIAGKRYAATFPRDATIDTNTFLRRQEGRFYEVFQITVNGERYTYKTDDGLTTVTDGKGRELWNGGPFGPFLYS